MNKKKYLLIIILILSVCGYSQKYIEPVIYHPTGLSSGDGAVKYHFHGYNQPIKYISYTMNDTLIGDSIYGLSQESVQVFAFDSLNGDTIGFAFFYTASLQSTLYQETFTEIIFDSIQSALTNYSCDGICHMTHVYDTSYVQTFYYDLFRWNDWNNYPYGDSISLNNLNVSGLCSNIYLLRINTFYGYPNTIFVTTFYIDPIISSQAQYEAEVITCPVSAQGNCDGMANGYVVNGTPPYLYSWDNSLFGSQDSIGSLCVGVHSLMVIDANNDTIGVNFGIVDSAHLYNNANPYYTAPYDTLYFITQNCSFDYNTPVDSAFISYYLAIDTNTIYLETEIWQAGIMTLASDTISYVFQGVNMIEMVFYCGNKSNNLIKIIDYTNIDYISGNRLNNSLSFNKSILVYPNPTSGMLYFQISENADIEKVEVLDIKGNLICTNTRLSPIDLSCQAKGIYFVKVIAEQGVVVKKVVLE